MSINSWGDPAQKGDFPPAKGVTGSSGKFRPMTTNGFFVRQLRGMPSRGDSINDISSTGKLILKLKSFDPTSNRSTIRFKSRQDNERFRTSSQSVMDWQKSKTRISDYNEKTKVAAPRTALLTASFKLRKDPNVSPETAEIACETVSGLLRRTFAGMEEYNAWSQREVEPFVLKLKKAIQSSKPQHIEEFVIGYCAREAMGQEHPKTYVESEKRPRTTLRRNLQEPSPIEYDQSHS